VKKEEPVRANTEPKAAPRPETQPELRVIEKKAAPASEPADEADIFAEIEKLFKK